MSAAAQQRLMSEYKGLEKEKWLNVEVCSPSSYDPVSLTKHSE